MRELTSHKVNGLNEDLDVQVIDEPGQGNACHEYTISTKRTPGVFCRIMFQNGPIQEVGVNGLSIESLLAVVEDRLEGLQAGPSGNRETATALIGIQEAIFWLQKSTRDRVARGVEGTHEK